VYRHLAVRVIFAVLAAALGAALTAQTFDMAAKSREIIALDGLMRFHPGDDPTLGWANPNFDDSSWALIRGNESWYAQGYPELIGFAWYRFKVTLPDHVGPMALWVPQIATNFEIYVDGRRIAAFGAMPPNARPRYGENFVFAIPADLARSGKTLAIAIRVWHYPWAFQLLGGLQEPMQLGDAGLIGEWQAHRAHEFFWTQAQSNINALVCLLAGLGAFLLFILRPADREFLWFGVWEVFNILFVLLQTYMNFHPVYVESWLLSSAVLIAGLNVSMPIFIRHFGRIGRTPLFWVAIAVALLDFLLNVLIAFNWISGQLFTEVGAVSKLLLAGSNCALLFECSKENKAEMRLFAVPIALYFVNLAGFYVASDLVIHGATWASIYFDMFNSVTTWPFPFGTFQATSIVVQLALFAILLLRFVRTRSDEERYKNELEAARTVQQVLVPDEIPTIAGFALESVYKPAGQVGGDFFQIIPIANGGVLVAIGDVSGKGMPAAMTVSLLVGTLRTLVHYTQSPAEILSAMNQRMLSRSGGGFTTCLVLTVTADGKLTAANAGHIAPYLNGHELALPNSLPLGLNAHEHYAESVFTLVADERLTLMTDGVVEARGANGELLGFDRAKAMMNQPADSIAKAAQDFGQDDDITVLTLRLAPAGILQT
jgi:hypothetical protein